MTCDGQIRDGEWGKRVKDDAKGATPVAPIKEHEKT
jgi:hypothetical protein